MVIKNLTLSQFKSSPSASLLGEGEMSALEEKLSCSRMYEQAGLDSLQHADIAISGRIRRETGQLTAAPALREAGDFETINQCSLKIVICRKQFASHRNGRRVQPHPACRQILPSLLSHFHNLKKIYYHQGLLYNN